MNIGGILQFSKRKIHQYNVTDMRQQPADMTLILKQTNKQTTDMSQQIGCRSE
jgi:hypothetical protein